MRYPSLPIIDQTLIDVNKAFGVDIVNRWIPSMMEREIAARFNVEEELRIALEKINAGKHAGRVVSLPSCTE